MRKPWKQLTAALLAVCLSVTCAQAVTINQEGDAMIRVGLASSSPHVPTGELEAAYLENNNSEGYGSGYRFGYYDGNLNFVELARTGPEIIQAAVLKTQNLYWGAAGGKQGYYSSITSNVLVGCYHVQIPGSYTYDTAQAEASRYSGGFPAWIDGAYQVRVGAYGTAAEAQSVLAGLPAGSQVVWTSAYGMNVVRTGSNQILFQYDCGASGKLAILPDVTGAGETRTWFAGFKYRGGFQYFRRSGGNLSVVNVLDLEDYVNGVVCYEMGRDWPLEALKAQAVCARTYVMGNLGKHNDYGFDICPSDSCQVYRGMGSGKADYGPSETSLRAVAETAGMVAKYNGRVADIFYVSSFGGASEDAKNIWGTDTDNEYPYLRGVVDPYEADLNDRNAMSPWTKTYTAAQLAQQLQNKNTSVDHLELTYSSLGNVIQVIVHWANGQKNTINAKDIRSRFNVRSIRFTINGAGTGTSEAPGTQPAGGTDSLEGKYIISGTGTVSQARGDVYAISGTGTVSRLETETPGDNGGGTAPVTPPGGGTVTVSGSTYTFNGGGWGHQVGMSQYGANAMARRGFTYDEIVTFYFPGVQVTHY